MLKETYRSMPRNGTGISGKLNEDLLEMDFIRSEINTSLNHLSNNSLFILYYINRPHFFMIIQNMDEDANLINEFLDSEIENGASFPVTIDLKPDIIVNEMDCNDENSKSYAKRCDWTEIDDSSSNDQSFDTKKFFNNEENRPIISTMEIWDEFNKILQWLNEAQVKQSALLGYNFARKKPPNDGQTCNSENISLEALYNQFMLDLEEMKEQIKQIERKKNDIVLAPNRIITEILPDTNQSIDSSKTILERREGDSLALNEISAEVSESIQIAEAFRYSSIEDIVLPK